MPYRLDQTVTYTRITEGHDVRGGRCSCRQLVQYLGGGTTADPGAGWFHVDLATTWEESEAASAAIHGGRHITAQLARLVRDVHNGSLGETVLDDLRESREGVWAYHIAPAGSGTVNERLASLALDRARRGLTDGPRPVGRLTVAEAEAMVSWPIYRAAVAAQVGEPLYVRGYAEGAANERANQALREAHPDR